MLSKVDLSAISRNLVLGSFMIICLTFLAQDFFFTLISKSMMAALNLRPEEEKVKCQENTFLDKSALFKFMYKPHTTFLLIYHCPELGNAHSCLQRRQEKVIFNSGWVKKCVANNWWNRSGLYGPPRNQGQLII